MKITFSGYEIRIVWKLHRGTYYGGKHTSIDHLSHGFPSHSGREIKSAIEELIKKQIIIVEKKTKEDHVCLNKNKIKLIYHLVDWFIDNMKLIDTNHLEKKYFEMDDE